VAITDEIPKSRLTLTYRTTVTGATQEVQLPFRVFVLGDLSGGTSRDRAVDLDRRMPRRLDGKNLDDVMSDMKMSVELKVPNRIDPDRSAELQVKLPIDSIGALAPASIAKNVPKVRALLLLKKLLLEVQANLDNRKEFRRLLRLLAQDKTAVASIQKQLEKFTDFKVPQTAGNDNLAKEGS
jgi:type VI secretion system protein ImpB